MALCPRCNANLPDRARFCLLCGAHVTESGGGRPRFESERQSSDLRGSSRPPTLDSDASEPLQERRKVSTSRSGIECRFCHSPLDLEGEFCESCGAPIAEAAPPGMIKPRPGASSRTGANPNPTPTPAPPAPATPPPAVPAPPERPEIASTEIFSPPPAKPQSTLVLTSPPLSAPRASQAEPSKSPEPEPSATRVITAPRGNAESTMVFSGPPLSAILRAPAGDGPQRKPPTADLGANSTMVLNGPPLMTPPRVPENGVGTPPTRPPASTRPPTVARPRASSVHRAAAIKPPEPKPPTRDSGPTMVVSSPPFAEPGQDLVAPHPSGTAPQAKKPFPHVIVPAGAAGIVVLAAVAWYIFTPKAPPPTVVTSPPTQVNPAPSTEPAETPLETTPQESVTTAETTPQQHEAPVEPTTPKRSIAPEPRKPRAKKSAPPPARLKTEISRQAAEIARLQRLARDAYTQGNYAQPAEASAITYAKRVLALDPNDPYAKTLIDDSVNGVKYKVQQAVQRNDFTAARAVANSLAQLLPERGDITALQKDIRTAEKANQVPRPQAPTATISFQAFHMHSEKAPADQGPYCEGTLGVIGDHIKFRGESAPDGEKIHSVDIPCSDVKDIKKNAHVASHQAGFHVRTFSENINFVPADSFPSHISALASACK